jgi:D-alanyl-D-alanine carboxypeptidase (penicillin-binding protein 5/6)
VRSGAALFALAAAAVPQSAAAAAPLAPMSDPASELTAPMALLVDLGSGRTLFARDVRRRFLPASLTKIMTAYVAFEMIAAGKLQPNQRMTVSDAAFDKWHRVGSTMFLARGQVVSVDELLNGIMTVSANDGCIVLAEGAAGSVPRFVALMNAEARRLGMHDSHFGSPNGWPDAGATYTSAQDLATLTRARLIRHPALYRHYVGHAEMTFNGIRQSNHVPIIGAVPGADGVKTGYTNESGYGFVGSAVRGGRRLLMVVAGYDRPSLRSRESRALLEWGFGAWQARRLFGRGEAVSEARVQGGAVRHVPLSAPMPFFLTLGRGERPDYRLSVRYSGPLEAPIARGAQVGELLVAMKGQAPYRLPLVASQAVERGGFWARLRDGLLGLFGA